MPSTQPFLIGSANSTAVGCVIPTACVARHLVVRDEWHGLQGAGGDPRIIQAPFEFYDYYGYTAADVGELLHFLLFR